MARKKAARQEEQDQSVLLKVSSAFVLDGSVVTKGELVEVTNAEAKRLLARGKADLATDKDVKAAKAKSEAAE
jgi:hypothetical protein